MGASLVRSCLLSLLHLSHCWDPWDPPLLGGSSLLRCESWAASPDPQSSGWTAARGHLVHPPISGHTLFEQGLYVPILKALRKGAFAICQSSCI